MVRSLTSSGVLSRMSWAYLRSILSSLACVTRRVDRVREPPFRRRDAARRLKAPQDADANLRVEERVDLARLHAGREVVHVAVVRLVGADGEHQMQDRALLAEVPVWPWQWLEQCGRDA